MLRNLEDERMRMVRPCVPGAGWVVALPLPLPALPTVGGVVPGAPWRAASPGAPSLAQSCRGEQREGRVNLLVGAHLKSLVVSCCWKMASAGAGGTCWGEEQVWCKLLSLPQALASPEPERVKHAGFRGPQEGFHGKGCRAARASGAGLDKRWWVSCACLCP